MSQTDAQDHFTETHHALLFGWIAKAVFARAGDQQGEAVIRKATRRYGEERGRRMALRAQANGHALTMANYLAYAEYNITRGTMDYRIVERVPHVRLTASRCPWHTAWQEHDLMPFGRLYCLDIDQALVRGFNPELQLDVNATRPDGAAQCDFLYRDANLTLPNAATWAYRKWVRPGGKAALPWDYHVGHLFATLEKVAVLELGEAGRQAIDAALAEFASHYGEPAVQKIVAGRGIDYDRLPAA